ncbi:MAG TPA: DUF6152 family protein, partial [Gammaproteobacteria bacterium]|nr:DUF6152 family protein [Gammaproteobacteria bacterium]
HNSVAIYDISQSVIITGTVTEVRFLNPHARIRLDVSDSNGATRNWLAEGANVIALRLQGWTGEEMKPGDRITVKGAPSRDGTPRIEWSEITLSDGRVLGGGNNFPKERDELLDRLEQQRGQQPSAATP